MNIGIGIGIKYARLVLKLVVHKYKSVFNLGVWDIKGRWSNNDIFKF